MVASAAVVLAVLVAGSGMLDWWTDTSDGGAGALASPRPTATASPTPVTSTPSPTPTPSPEPTQTTPVLFLTGDFPTAGSGRFALATDEGEEVGDSGQRWRYRVAVERDAGADVDEFARIVADTLAADQGWAAGGDYRFQQVPDGAGHDFTVYLVTSETAAQMCGAGGLVVIAPGLPEGGVSCRLSGQVIINLSRWRLSVAHYVEAGVPLEVYRQMLLNHEVGHELGYGHFACPGRGQPAPVMQQQSIDLEGCEAYPWPYLDGEFYGGPPAA